MLSFANLTANKYTLSATTEVVGLNLEVKVFLKNNFGEPEKLGNVSLKMKVISSVNPLILDRASLSGKSSFDQNSSYDESVAGHNIENRLLTLNINRDISGDGITIPNDNIELGTILVPLTNVGPEINLSWRVYNGDFTTFDGRSIQKEEILTEKIVVISSAVENPIGFRTATNISTLVKEEPILSLGFSPNPVNFEGNLNVDLDRNGEITLEVYDINGRLISSRKETVVKGFNTFVIHAGNLVPGAYLVRTIIENSIQNIKFIKK